MWLLTGDALIPAQDAQFAVVMPASGHPLMPEESAPLKPLANHGSSGSLNDFKVVQDCQDVLRHKDITSVQGHPHNGDQHGVSREFRLRKVT
ncbi:hypothetical protein FKM82_030566 [Ascaphus truei]